MARLKNIFNNVEKTIVFTAKNKRSLVRKCLKGWKWIRLTQLTLPCSKSTIKTLEKGVKYVQS